MLCNTILPLERKWKSSITSESSAGVHKKTIFSAVVTSSVSNKRPRTSVSSSFSSPNTNETIELLQNIHPSDYARAAFKANGFGDFASIASDCDARVLPATPAMLEAYSTEIVQEVRNNNLEGVKKLYEEGRFQHGCNACNRFGESILHIACRRGHLEMVKFLVGEVGLSITGIRDDYKRTPLHDAFWTSKASPDVVDYLLQQPNVMELLLCKDQRGFTPLHYSRGEDRGKWLRFLWERRDDLRPSKVDEEDDDCSSVISNPSKRQRIMA